MTLAPITRFICHFAFWFGLLFATPVFIALHNVADIGLDPSRVAVSGLIATLILSAATYLLAALLPPRQRAIADRVFLVLAFLLAIWGNVIHDLHEFATFDGRPVNFRHHDTLFWLESLAWPIVAVMLYRWFARLRAIPAWLPALPAASFLLLLAPAVMQPPQAGLEAAPTEPVDESVYAFSSVMNLVHLLPDGFQGDTVRRTFEEHPELAARFDGFTLYTDHLGRYPGTAPSLYSMLTGEPFPLERGFAYSWVGPETREKSYQAELARNGFQVDLVPISNYICPGNANSCTPRPFKNRGLAQSGAREAASAARLLADLSLFRLAPVVLKEKIYDGGYWLLSDIGAGDDAPVPDPVLRDWTKRLHVVDDRPVYKWYHYVGTHVPPHWDANCILRRGLAPTPDNYRDQTRCILEGIADLVDRLRAEGIYDQTAILVSGDHGHNTVPLDQASTPLNFGMFEPLLGTGRPALLVKPSGARGPLSLSDRPSHLLNIAPTARTLAGLAPNGESVFDLPRTLPAARVFEHYPIGSFWSGDPVPYLQYAVGQPANDAGLWRLADMVNYATAPGAYLPVNKDTAKGYVHGARLRSSWGRDRWSWVRGRQLAFLLDMPGLKRGRLELELWFEPWMHGQSADILVNGVRLVDDQALPANGLFSAWQTLAVPVNAAQLRDGPDFVSILFGQSYPDPADAGSFASARIRSIRFVPEIDAP
jgi:hypothetical protein